MIGDGLNSLIPDKSNQNNEENFNESNDELAFNFPNINPTPPQNQVRVRPNPDPEPESPPEESVPEPEEDTPPQAEPNILTPTPQIPIHTNSPATQQIGDPSYEVKMASSNLAPEPEEEEEPAITKNFSKGKPSEHVFQLEVDKIRPNPYQPRRYFDESSLNEMASSIAEFGIIQPLVVTKKTLDTNQGTDVEYELIAGERRLRAAKIAGLERVPAIIKQPQPKKEKLELAIIENIQRKDLNPIESARSFATLQDDYNMTQREIAARMGKSRESIANTMRLLSLPTYVQEAIQQSKISESQGRLLLGVSDINTQHTLFKELITKGLTIKELRNKVSNTNARTNAIKRFTNEDPELRHLAERLSELLGTKVKVEQNGDTGKITISFGSADELKGIIDRVIPEGDI